RCGLVRRNREVAPRGRDFRHAAVWAAARTEATIGQAKTEIVPSLIVFNSRGAALQGGKLVLSGRIRSSLPIDLCALPDTTPRHTSWRTGTKAATTSPRTLPMRQSRPLPRMEQG